jgi:hypothetical protein
VGVLDLFHIPARFRAPDGTIAERGFLLVFRKGRG